MNKNLMRQRLAAVTAAAKAKQLAKADELETNLQVVKSEAQAIVTPEQVSAEAIKQDIHFDQHQEVPLGKNQITLGMLNDKQLQGVTYAKTGTSFCLIGSAGTGKTTTQRIVVSELETAGTIQPITNYYTKSDVYSNGMLAIGIFSFTNKAVNNIREALPEKFRAMCTTFHTVLEYHPVFEEYEDFDSKGQPVGTKTSMEFIPRFGKTAGGKGDGFSLPHLDVVIIEESGSVPTELFDVFLSALPFPERTVFIFLGDLNQLPPVFGDAILGFKLLELPIVELTEPYRAALLSPITKLADTIKNGISLNDTELKAFEELNGQGYGEINIIPFKAKARGLDPKIMADSFGTFVYNWVKEGTFDPNNSVILMPFNKGFGTIEINKHIGEALRHMGGLTTYHVIAGEQSHYFCEGDRVMYGKVECRITGFKVNTRYNGIMPLNASAQMTRWGANEGSEALTRVALSLDEMLELTGEQMGDAGVARQSSHLIQLESLDGKYRYIAASAGEVNSIIFTWALSVHKSQGSEWPHVIFVCHDAHKKMWKRELIYTAITRAREKLDVYYSGQRSQYTKDSAFQVGVTRSEYNAVSLEGKLNYFRSQLKKMEIKKHAAANKQDYSQYRKGL